MSPYRTSGKRADPAESDGGVARAMFLVAVALVVAFVALRPEGPPGPRSGAMGMASPHAATLSRVR
jgi:hypothetical protein